MAYDGVKRYYETHCACVYLHLLFCYFRVIESGEEVVMRTRIPRYINPMVRGENYCYYFFKLEKQINIYRE